MIKNNKIGGFISSDKINNTIFPKKEDSNTKINTVSISQKKSILNIPEYLTELLNSYTNIKSTGNVGILSKDLDNLSDDVKKEIDEANKYYDYLESNNLPLIAPSPPKDK